MRVVRVVSAGICILTVTAVFQNCTPKEFSMIDPELKKAKVGGESVFGGGEGEIDVTGAPDNGEVPAFEPGQEYSPDGSANTNPTNGDMTVKYVCSDRRSQDDGNVAEVASIRVEVLNDKKSVVCSFTDSSVRSSILNQKKFALSRLASKCGSVANGRYTLRLRDPARGIHTNLVVSGENIDRVTGGWKRVGGRLAVVADRNPETSSQSSSVNCDELASPLVIHMHADVEKAEPLVLTSPRHGVWFDILGGNADPVPHSPRRISWHRSDQYYYIALPNSRGEVRGIDQLFGDNTFGPDGRYATDGFAALAKYDGKTADGSGNTGRPDGYITDADPIYSKLRLWRDLNFDGIAQKSELQSLAEAGIDIIDLKYDPNYLEVDRHGNETRFKSVVQDRSGRLHLLFDVWFNTGTPKRTAPSVVRGLASVR